MSIVYACIVPHTPVLVPTIGREYYQKLKATTDALAAVRISLTNAAPETIVICAPHARAHEQRNPTLHVPAVYRSNFSEFGDIVTTAEYQPDTVVADAIKNTLNEAKISVVYESDAELEYGASVPLQHLGLTPLPKIVVLHPGESETLKESGHIGMAVQRALQASPKRIALIASGDLSHCLTENAPGVSIRRRFTLKKRC